MKKAAGRVTAILLSILSVISLIIFIMGCLFTWRLGHYDKELSAYLSTRLNSKINLDLTDVTWHGISPVLTFKTIQVNQKTADFSSQLNGLNVKINLLKSLISWSIAPDRIELNHLTISAHLDRENIQSSAQAAKEMTTENFQDIRKITQSTLSQILGYIDGIQPNVVIKSLKLNFFGKNDKQIALMGSLSIAHHREGGYYLNGQLVTALKRSAFDFDFQIGKKNNQVHLEGYFNIHTNDLQKAVNFVGLDMLYVKGKRLSHGGYISFQPDGMSHIALRLNGHQLLIRNTNRHSKITFNQIVMDIGGQYDQDGQFQLKLVPHELEINGQKRFFKQLEVGYASKQLLPWRMNLNYGQLEVLNDIRHVIPKKMLLAQIQPYVNSGKFEGLIKTLKIRRASLFDLDSAFIVDADFSNVSYFNNELNLYLNGISGKVFLSNQKGRVNITAKSLNFNQSILGINHFPKASLKTNLNWYLRNNQLDLNIQSLLLTGGWFNVATNGQINWNLKNKLPLLNLVATASVNNITQSKIRGLLPQKAIKPKLYNWLYNNLYSAKNAKAELLLKGNLKDFPFVDQQGIFRLKTTVDDGRLTPWVNWPLITHANGSFQFEGKRFKVNALSGETLGVKVLPSSIVVDDIRPNIVSNLSFDLNTKTNSVDARDYIIHSPLKNYLNTWLDWVDYTGDLNSKIKIVVPLGNKDPMRVNGLVNLVKGALSLKAKPFVIHTYQTNGQIKFYDKKITYLDVNGWLGLNAPFFVHFSEPKKGYYSLQSEATLSDTMSLPLAIRSKLAGNASAYLNATWDVKGGDLAFRSNFNGLSFNLPMPFFKMSKKTDYPTNMMLSWKKKDEKLSELKLNARLSNNFDLIGNFDKTPKLLNLILNLKSLDLSAWIGLVNELANGDHKEKTIFASLLKLGLPNESADHQSKFAKVFLRSPLTLNQQLNNLLNEYSPKLLININKLMGFGQVFDQVKVTSQSTHSSWQLKLNSKNAQNHIAFLINVPFDEKFWQFNISDLKFSKINHFEFLKGNMGNGVYFPWWIPSSEVSIDRLNYRSFNLLDESNFVIEQKPSLFAIPYYLFKGSDIFLLGTLNWHANNNKLILNGSATSNNWGSFFDHLGFEHIIANGEGPVVFDLSYVGGLSPKIDSMDGKIMFGINKGEFPKLNPGLSKLIGIFSIEAILDRIGSGADDLNKSGLYFNRIYGNYTINNGLMQTVDDALVNTPSFDMQVSGSVNFVNQTIDQLIVIQPRLSGTMAIAAGLIGGPIAGFATYLVDKLVGASILKNQGITKISITGPWDKPLINGK